MNLLAKWSSGASPAIVDKLDHISKSATNRSLGRMAISRDDFPRAQKLLM